MNQFANKTLGQAVDQLIMLALQAERARILDDFNRWNTAAEKFTQAEKEFGLAFNLGQKYVVTF